MIKLVPRLALLAIFALISAPGIAAPDTETVVDAASTSDLEILVMEAPGCIYCSLFRRDVQPTYEASARARSIPLRYVDVNDLDAAHLELDGPVDLVPTVVVIQGKKEVGRIPGYVGPENFFHALNYLLSQAQ